MTHARREARTTPLPEREIPVAPVLEIVPPAPAAETPLNIVRLRNGKVITLKELMAADEFAVEKMLQGEGMNLDGVGQASYLRALSFASIHSIDGKDENPLENRDQFRRHLKAFSSRDATTLLQAFLRFSESLAAPAHDVAPEVLPPHQVRLRDGTLITLKELTALDEFAVEKILQTEGITLVGAGQATYLRALAFASIHSIGAEEKGSMEYPEQFHHYLKRFTARDATTLLQAFVRFSGGDDDATFRRAG